VARGGQLLKHVEWTIYTTRDGEFTGNEVSLDVYVQLCIDFLCKRVAFTVYFEERDTAHVPLADVPVRLSHVEFDEKIPECNPGACD